MCVGFVLKTCLDNGIVSVLKDPVLINLMDSVSLLAQKEDLASKSRRAESIRRLVVLIAEVGQFR